MKSKLFTIVLMLFSSASAVSAAQFEYVTAGVDDAMRSVVANHLGIAVGDPGQTILRLSSMALSDSGRKLAARVKVQTATDGGWANVADFIAVFTLDENGRGSYPCYLARLLSV